MNRDESLRLEIYDDWFVIDLVRLEIYDDWFVIDLVTFNIRLLLLPSEYTKKNVKFKTSLIRAYNGTWFNFVAERFHGET
jgi:predicted nuclease of restriction endonuclease-like (RecB) superfamily